MTTHQPLRQAGAQTEAAAARQDRGLWGQLRDVPTDQWVEQVRQSIDEASSVSNVTELHREIDAVYMVAHRALADGTEAFIVDSESGVDVALEPGQVFTAPTRRMLYGQAGANTDPELLWEGVRHFYARTRELIKDISPSGAFAEALRAYGDFLYLHHPEGQRQRDLPTMGVHRPFVDAVDFGVVEVDGGAFVRAPTLPQGDSLALKEELLAQLEGREDEPGAAEDESYTLPTPEQEAEQRRRRALAARKKRLAKLEAKLKRERRAAAQQAAKSLKEQAKSHWGVIAGGTIAMVGLTTAVAVSVSDKGESDG